MHEDTYSSNPQRIEMGKGELQDEEDSMGDGRGPELGSGLPSWHFGIGVRPVIMAFGMGAGLQVRS